MRLGLVGKFWYRCSVEQAFQDLVLLGYLFETLAELPFVFGEAKARCNALTVLARITTKLL